MTEGRPPLKDAIASRKARLGCSIETVRTARVIGEASLTCSQDSIAVRSYELPSGSTTGSSIIFIEIGHMNDGGMGMLPSNGSPSALGGGRCKAIHAAAEQTEM